MGLLLLGNRGRHCLVSSPSLPGTPAPLCSRLPQQPPPPRELNLPTTRPVRGLIILSELCMELYLLQETRAVCPQVPGSSTGDFFPGCGFLITSSSLPGVQECSPQCPLAPAQREPSLRLGWAWVASPDTSPVSATSYVQCSLPGLHTGALSLRFRCAA